MFPKYETIETDYMVGMVWSKEDLIAPFSFPIYKSESVYKREVEAAAGRVYPVFDLSTRKASESNWLDSLNTQFTKLIKVVEYENEFQKEEISLVYSDFQEVAYSQLWTKEFIKGLSILDYIFCHKP